MTTRELIVKLNDMPQDQEINFYIPDLERKGDTSAYNWRAISDIHAQICEHDDYVYVELGDKP